jgi:hypothetical protein
LDRVRCWGRDRDRVGWRGLCFARGKPRSGQEAYRRLVLDLLHERAGDGRDGEPRYSAAEDKAGQRAPAEMGAPAEHFLLWCGRLTIVAGWRGDSGLGHDGRVVGALARHQDYDGCRNRQYHQQNQYGQAGRQTARVLGWRGWPGYWDPLGLRRCPCGGRLWARRCGGVPVWLGGVGRLRLCCLCERYAGHRCPGKRRRSPGRRRGQRHRRCACVGWGLGVIHIQRHAAVAAETATDGRCRTTGARCGCGGHCGLLRSPFRVTRVIVSRAARRLLQLHPA